MTITDTEVRNILLEAGLRRSAISIKDASYETTPRTEIHRIHAAWMRSMPEELKRRLDTHPVTGTPIKTRWLPKWIEDCFDCDNHAADFITFACRANALTGIRKKTTRHGLAAGTMSYRADGNGRYGPHAACWFINHQRKLNFYEPADDNIISLSEKERKSTWDGWCV
jgi:hypothetical protein